MADERVEVQVVGCLRDGVLIGASKYCLDCGRDPDCSFTATATGRSALELALGRAYAVARVTTCGQNDDNDVDANAPGVADAINAAWADVDRLAAALRAYQGGTDG